MDHQSKKGAKRTLSELLSGRLVEMTVVKNKDSKNQNSKDQSSKNKNRLSCLREQETMSWNQLLTLGLPQPAIFEDRSSGIPSPR